MTDKTLREYLEFLRAHGFASEARFYNNEVVKIVSTSTGFSPAQVLELPTKKVIEALIRAKDMLNKVEVPQTNYDVVLT